MVRMSKLILDIRKNEQVLSYKHNITTKLDVLFNYIRVNKLKLNNVNDIMYVCEEEYNIQHSNMYIGEFLCKLDFDIFSKFMMETYVVKFNNNDISRFLDNYEKWHDSLDGNLNNCIKSNQRIIETLEKYNSPENTFYFRKY
jgi:hypothetical protein